MYPAQIQHLGPQTTAHLAQTMSLLSMTSAELKQKIDGELANNPALELLEPRSCRVCGRSLVESGPCPICSQPPQLHSDEPIVFASSRGDYFDTVSNGPTNNIVSEELPEDNLAPSIDLATYIFRQIGPDIAEEDRPIAAYILTNLDDDGILQIHPIEISQYHHIPLSRVEHILTLIRQSDPIGVGATSPQEALLIQLALLSNQDEVPELAERAIREGMDLISKQHYSKLGRLLGITQNEALEISRFISTNLNPYPGRSHWGSIRQGSREHPQVYHHPDIIINTLNGQSDGPLVVEILFPVRGSLRINPLFRKIIKEAPAGKVEKWQEDYSSANLLIKCLRQRGNTMRQLLTIITKIQRQFILNGDRNLKPITRAGLAELLDVHESTVSRAVSGKTVSLPNGRIIPLSKFFDRSLPIRTLISEIISTEKEALTDTQIAQILDDHGYHIARRTVAKYRAMEGIPSARYRKNQTPTLN